MIIESILMARAAANMVRETQLAIREVSGLHSHGGFGAAGNRARYSDSVASAVTLLDSLNKTLARQQKYADVCQARMLEDLHKIPSSLTQQVFLRREYDRCTWPVVSQRVGIGMQAAKMRYIRYLRQEKSNEG
jgi:hypothetical protein